MPCPKPPGKATNRVRWQTPLSRGWFLSRAAPGPAAQANNTAGPAALFQSSKAVRRSPPRSAATSPCETPKPGVSGSSPAAPDRSVEPEPPDLQASPAQRELRRKNAKTSDEPPDTVQRGLFS